MSSLVPLFTGFLARGRQKRDLKSAQAFTIEQDKSQQAADLTEALKVQD